MTKGNRGAVLEYSSEDSVYLTLELPNDKGIFICEDGEDLIISFQGEGHRYVKEVQNRSDGHSSIVLTKQQ